ncbi:hypothetical protein DB347_08030 [Opitutaceae bacterium EW11]|nr:hypothetical protein DB347_08030 [Opitutaceae bacterium EW11]
MGDVGFFREHTGAAVDGNDHRHVEEGLRSPIRFMSAVEIRQDAGPNRPVFSKLHRFALWLARKLIAVALIGGLAIAAYATWLFLHAQGDFASDRAKRLVEMSARRERVSTNVIEVGAELDALQNQIRSSQDRIAREKSTIALLDSLDSRWERWFGNREQQRVNDERKKRLSEMLSKDSKRLLELQRALNQKAWEREGASAELARLDAEIRHTEGTQSQIVHYLNASWKRLRAPLAFLLLLDLFGAYLWRLTLYFGVAPFVQRGRPLRFAKEVPVFPQETASRGSFDVAVWPGERLRVKRKYLRSTDGGVEQGTRVLLDWWRPISSLLCGFVGLAELRNRQARGESEIGLAGREGDELAMLDVPDGSSLVVKPRFLVGVVQPADQSLVTRMRWPVWSRQAWVTGQIRFLEFFGPCRLIVAGTRGVRAEHMVPGEAGVIVPRRAERATLIGFTPNLELRLVRTQAFKSYLLGRKRLFEVLFTGPGLYAVAFGPYERGTGPLSRAFFGVRNRVLDILGL